MAESVGGINAVNHASSPVAVAEVSPRRTAGQREQSDSCFSKAKARTSVLLHVIVDARSRSIVESEVEAPWMRQEPCRSQKPKDMCGDHQWRADVTRRCSGHDNRVSRFGVRQHLSKLSVVVDQSRATVFVRGRALLGVTRLKYSTKCAVSLLGSSRRFHGCRRS